MNSRAASRAWIVTIPITFQSFKNVSLPWCRRIITTRTSCWPLWSSTNWIRKSKLLVSRRLTTYFSISATMRILPGTFCSKRWWFFRVTIMLWPSTWSTETMPTLWWGNNSWLSLVLGIATRHEHRRFAGVMQFQCILAFNSWRICSDRFSGRKVQESWRSSAFVEANRWIWGRCSTL